MGAFTISGIAALDSEVLAYLRETNDWKDCILYDTNEIAIGVIPANTEFFNAANAFGVCNLEKVNEVPFPFICTHIGVQMFGATISDTLIMQEHTDLVLEKDQRRYVPWPVCALPGGGGLSLVIAEDTAATTTEYATHGVGGDQFWKLPTPFAIGQRQVFRCWLRGDGVGTLVAALTVRVLLRGITARTVL